MTFPESPQLNVTVQSKALPRASFISRFSLDKIALCQLYGRLLNSCYLGMSPSFFKCVSSSISVAAFSKSFKIFDGLSS